MNTTLATPYRWTCHDGRKMLPSEMKTSHLFYTVRMIFNHTVPYLLRIQGCKQWMLRLSADERRAAMKALLLELASRKDIAPEHLDQIEYMHATAARYARHDEPYTTIDHEHATLQSTSPTN